jgi:hypothetical protein
VDASDGVLGLVFANPKGIRQTASELRIPAHLDLALNVAQRGPNVGRKGHRRALYHARRKLTPEG